jgi:hypothetical protein
LQATIPVHETVPKQTSGVDRMPAVASPGMKRPATGVLWHAMDDAQGGRWSASALSAKREAESPWGDHAGACGKPRKNALTSRLR